MKFYNLDEIRAVGNCIQYATTVLGLEINHEGRCQATWRGGDGFNVSISEHKWFDHVAKVGGGIVELCAIAKCGDIKDFQSAQEILGEMFNLTPKMVRGEQPMVSAKHEGLLADGYVEVKRYGYLDLEGNLIHFVARLEHPEKDKEFMQGSPSGWGLRGITPILYRMADWVDKTFVAIVEGEKDVDTLVDRLGIPATTNCGGADKWRPEYAELFRDKNVIIVRDNDEAGEAHASRVSRELKDAAKRIVVICPSSQPKGDVTDWVEQEGGTSAALMEMAKNTEEVKLEELEVIDPLLEQAKQSNKYSFKNYIPEKQVVGNQTKVIRKPRKLNDLIKDVFERFIGFPRRVGDSKYMFDHDRKTGEIFYIERSSSLVSWIARKSDHLYDWEGGGRGMVEKAELYEGLIAECQTYESISMVPDWPRRNDVYYAHEKLPEPSEGFKYFYDFCAMFNPVDEDNMTLLRAFVCAPLWYINGIPRPSWMFDSVEGAGVGKTTFVEIVSRLYGVTPIRTNRQQLKNDVDELTKRVVSTTGRLARILLVDNIVGKFESPELADMMTAESISGKAPYGRGEESRPNNLTYVITANSGSLDNDLADRCIVVKFAKAPRSSNWRTDVLNYVEEHRLQIIADMIAMLESAAPMESEPKTRFPEFECTILRAVCRSEDELQRAIAAMLRSKADANVDAEFAARVEEEFQTSMLREANLQVQPGQQNIFILGTLAEQWMREIFTHEEMHGNLMQKLRGFAMNGHSNRFYAKIERVYVGQGKARNQRRGILWLGNPENPEQIDRIIGLKGKQVVELQS